MDVSGSCLLAERQPGGAFTLTPATAWLSCLVDRSAGKPSSGLSCTLNWSLMN